MVINQAQAGVVRQAFRGPDILQLLRVDLFRYQTYHFPPVVDRLIGLNAFRMTINTPCTTISNTEQGFLAYILHVMSIYTMRFGFLSLLRRPKKIFLRVKTGFLKK
ncbi:MAG: hypothetical protein IPL08_13235 [Saprospiraceae bacterium]|nr:hypothetical protein [Saprospiraceae bacterium]